MKCTGAAISGKRNRVVQNRIEKERGGTDTYGRKTVEIL